MLDFSSPQNPPGQRNDDSETLPLEATRPNQLDAMERKRTAKKYASLDSLARPGGMALVFRYYSDIVMTKLLNSLGVRRAVVGVGC